MHLAVPNSVSSTESDNSLCMLEAVDFLCLHEIIARPVSLHLCCSVVSSDTQCCSGSC
jgi:hypothetical protein